MNAFWFQRLDQGIRCPVTEVTESLKKHIGCKLRSSAKTVTPPNPWAIPFSP